MIVAVGLDGVVQLSKKILTVACQKIEPANPALLQPLPRIERLAESLRVAAHQFALLRFRPRHLGLEFFQLMLHF